MFDLPTKDCFVSGPCLLCERDMVREVGYCVSHINHTSVLLTKKREGLQNLGGGRVGTSQTARICLENWISNTVQSLSHEYSEKSCALRSRRHLGKYEAAMLNYAPLSEKLLSNYEMI